MDLETTRSGRIINNPQWGFICGRISVLEERILPRDFFLSLLHLQHVDEVLQRLQETLLRNYLTPGSPWEDFSAIADHFFYDLAVSIREECPSPVPANLFLVQNDFLNIRIALASMKNFPFPSGLVPVERLQAIANRDFSDIPFVFLEFPGKAGPGMNELSDALPDVAADGAYLRQLMVLSNELQNPFIARCIDFRILAHGTCALLRALRQGRSLKEYSMYFLPLGQYNSKFDEISRTTNPDLWPAIIGGEVGNLLSRSFQVPFDEQIAFFKLLADNHHLSLAEEGRLQTSGPERVYSFLTGLQTEIQNLKLLVGGVMNRIDFSSLRERLREVYG